MNQGRGVLLPFYLVVDVSYSMSGSKLESANKSMSSVRDALAQDPILADKVRFGVIDFSSDARVQLPLCDLLDEKLTLPTLSIRGATSYAAAFRLLRSEIAANVQLLKGDGYKVHRPAVFFLSDGEPNPEDWQSAFRELTFYDTVTKSGFAMYPNIVPCGVGGANGDTLKTLIHPATGGKQMQMYLMDKGEDAAKAITAVAEVLISSMLASGQSAAHGESGIILPAKEDVPAGISAYNADDWV